MAAGEQDVRPIADAVARHVTTVAGRVVSLTLSSADTPPQLVARLDDGTGTIDAVFIGRRGVAGIEPGAHLRITGRVADHAVGPRIFNPRYDLVAG